MKRWLLLLVALLPACKGDDAVPPNPNHLEGELAMELRDRIGVVIDIDPTAATLHAKLTPNASYDVLPSGTTLEVDGRLMKLPEAGSTLYTAKLDLPPVPAGPCGSDPISAALSLHRQGNNATVMGSLAIYCGASTWHGIPARMLRLAGDLPIPQ
jgi:hypothetical protein